MQRAQSRRRPAIAAGLAARVSISNVATANLAAATERACKKRPHPRLRQHIHRSDAHRAVRPNANRHPQRIEPRGRTNTAAESKVRLLAGHYTNARVRGDLQLFLIDAAEMDGGKTRPQQPQLLQSHQRTAAAGVIHVHFPGREVHGDTSVELVSNTAHARESLVVCAESTMRREI